MSVKMQGRALLFGVGVAACLTIGLVLWRFDPITVNLFPPCLFHLATGLYCPGCGSTRAIHQLLHGNITEAIRYNPLMVMAVPVVVYEIAADLSPIMARKCVVSLFRKPIWGYMLVYVLVAYWILRNVPLYPLTFLAPHG